MNNKKMYFILTTFIVLIVGLGAISAANVDNTNATSNQGLTDNADTMTVQSTDNIAKDTSESKIIKNKIETQKYNVKQSTYTEYFNDDGTLSDSISEGDTINLDSNITLNDKSLTINKKINLNGNGYTINLNTSKGYDSATKHNTAFNVISDYVNITNVKFYNTQVFVDNTDHVTFDNITSEVKNQGVGMGTGIFAIRGSTNTTVKNSEFNVVNNTGCSVLVLTLSQDCLIDNNTITGSGSVGNLLYLNTFNAIGTSLGNNSNNNLTNNKITGPSNPSAICYAISINGPYNYIYNNTVNYGGRGITTAWNGVYYEDTNITIDDWEILQPGNSIINNTLNGCGIYSGQHSSVKGNILTGTLSAGSYSDVYNNQIGGTVTINASTHFKANTLNSTSTVIGSNSILCHNTFKKLLTINNGVSNTTLCSNDFRKDYENNGESLNNVSSCILCSDNVNTNNAKKIYKSSKTSSSLKTANGDIPVFDIIINSEDPEDKYGFDYGRFADQPDTVVCIEDYLDDHDIKGKVIFNVKLNGNFEDKVFGTFGNYFIMSYNVDASNATLTDCNFEVSRKTYGGVDTTRYITVNNAVLKYNDDIPYGNAIFTLGPEEFSSNCGFNNVTISGTLAFGENYGNVIPYSAPNFTINN